MAKLRVTADYPTIQAAVDAASPGDVILVDKGIYHESVTIAKDGINLTACEAVTLAGGFELEDGFVVSGADVGIEGFCVREFNASGFFCHDARRLALQNCTAENCGTDGIYLTRCEGVRLLCCNFSANGICGLEAYDTPDLLAAECRIISNGGSGVRCDSAAPGAGVTLRGCEVARNNGIGVWGLRCNLGLIECDIMGNTQNGVQLDDCPGSLIECGSVTGQWGDGVVVCSDRCEIKNCRIASNEGTGLYITGTGCQVTGNLICRNEANGIFLRGVRNNVCTNTVTQNTPFDILRAAPNNTLRNNVTCNDNPAPLTGRD